MSPHGLSRNHVHPYVGRNQDTHGHVRPTPLNYLPDTAPALPFRWMSKDAFGELREHSPLDEVDEGLEPHLSLLAWAYSMIHSEIEACTPSHRCPVLLEPMT